MADKVYFDSALSIFAQITAQAWGKKALEENLFLRDADGRLTLIVQDGHPDNDRQQLAETVREKLKGYVDAELAVATSIELFDERLESRDDARKYKLNDEAFTGWVWLLDRRLVGADWLREPAKAVSGPARFVFASIKGGVGRSTALCVVAAHLAARGKRVLTIDLDLEAPGLGNMLLPGETLPEFGLLDFLVEQHLGTITDEFFADLKASSWLGGGKGRVDVIPAIGRRSLQNPENVLGKIARAYLVGAPNAKGDVSTFTDHIISLLERVAVSQDYDVVLIDARAGLHETSAAAIIGLGAEVFLFGIDQTQTIAGHQILFAHLATLLRGGSNEWRERINLIQAKASSDLQAQALYAEKIQGLIKQYLWPSKTEKPVVPDLQELAGKFETEWGDPVEIDEEIDPPLLAVIPDSSQYDVFDPLKDQSTLEDRIYMHTFGNFLTKIDEMLADDRN